MDSGDVAGSRGTGFTTKTGEISIQATEVTLLAKSLQVLPEKFHGLTDTDMRYRQRYVDLIMNAEVKDTFIKRSKILDVYKRQGPGREQGHYRGNGCRKDSEDHQDQPADGVHYPGGPYGVRGSNRVPKGL